MLSPGSGWVAYWNVWELTVLPTETDPKIEPGGSHLVYIPADEEVSVLPLLTVLSEQTNDETAGIILSRTAQSRETLLF